ncbi:phosphodiesterase [Rhodoferax koreense]|uniref:Phosphodiesterase n=2 Tax=Rhodoferax koreensis TaxID=1842727 RepID=A0A1P8K3K0_9BURK|nr:phosphodiesterase [Rhodoferax koreense]APW40584.1 phosphodiesterase [Rhodoferax koreense]
MQPTTLPHPQDADYEDLLSLWADLESGLAMVLGNPLIIPDFERKLRQYDRWMQDLLRQDTDTGLYLLFQLATNASVGYSALHALVSAVICHLTAAELQLPREERDSLVLAAMTMNIAMTRLQDELAAQAEKPNPQQQASIQAHAFSGRLMLIDVGVEDSLWVNVVAAHHDVLPLAEGELMQWAPVDRLAHILRTVDRYAAMISPRKTRAGRTATESVRSIMAAANGPSGTRDPVGFALVRATGLCPPGTYVRMDNGDVAVVLRRSATPNHPLVATVLNRAGDTLSPPRLHRTATSSPLIQAALTQDAIKIRINHQSLLRQGIQADKTA